MRVLVVGGGGREHALAYALAKSPSTKRLFCAPGNPGIARLAHCKPLDPEDLAVLRGFVDDERIDLVVPGPERAIAAGIADALLGSRARVFAPTRAGALLESSKIFGARFRQQFRIPGPRAIIAETKDEALTGAQELVRDHGGVAVKADGLCAGKGVVVASSVAEAAAAIAEMMEANRFGAAGARVVLEERLVGTELSVIALCDGERAFLLAPAQDYKRLHDGNTGPNTGGMGSLAPAPGIDDALLRRVRKEVLEPTLAGMASLGTPFRGVLYAGILLKDGDRTRTPFVLEYNARFGDPETQALLPLMGGDLAAQLYAAAGGALQGSERSLASTAGASVCVVLASTGYPESPRTGDVIHGIEGAEARGALVFHAGTARRGDELVTAGGRVLSVTATAPTLPEAAARAHAAAAEIRFDGAQRRRDIGLVSNAPSAAALPS